MIVECTIQWAYELAHEQRVCWVTFCIYTCTVSSCYLNSPFPPHTNHHRQYLQYKICIFSIGLCLGAEQFPPVQRKIKLRDLCNLTLTLERIDFPYCAGAKLTIRQKEMKLNNHNYCVVTKKNQETHERETD